MMPSPRILSREALLAFLAAILVSMAFFPQAWFQGKSLYSTDLVLQREPWISEWAGNKAESRSEPNPELGDLNDYFFPQLAFAVRTRHETGVWPLWNPEIYTGVSLIGNPQIPLWNPFIRVLPWFQEADQPFSPWRLSLGLTWTGIARFILCLFFAFLWLRRLGAGTWIASCVALFVAAGPYASLWRFSTPEQVFSLLPMVLYFLEGLRERWHAPSLVAASFAFGLSCLGGYPQTSLVFGLFLVPWFWTRSIDAGSGAAGSWAAGSWAGILRLAPVLGLGITLAMPCWLPFLSYMGESWVGEVRQASAALDSRATWWPNPWPILFPNITTSALRIESHQAALGLPLILLLCLGLWRQARSILVAVILLLLLHLDFLPLGNLQRLLLPLLEPSRVAVLLPLLAAWAWFRADQQLIGRIPGFMRICWNLIALVVLLWPGIGFHSSLSSSEVYPQTETIRFLQQEHSKDPDLRFFQVDAGILDRNAPLVFDLPLALGTDGMDPRRFVYLAVHLLPKAKQALPRTLWTSGLLRLDIPLFDQLATRLILARKGQALPKHFRVLRESGDLVVAENPRAAPRAELFSKAVSLEEDPYRLLEMKSSEALVLDGKVPPLPGPAMSRGSVEITQRASDRMTLESDANGASYLLLRDNLLAGWQARIDGKSVPILHGNFAFRALVLPEGKHEIEFLYSPVSYGWGRTLALLSIAILLLLLMLSRLRGGRGRSGSP